MLDLSKEAKSAMEVLSEAMKSACYIYEADFRYLENFT